MSACSRGVIIARSGINSEHLIGSDLNARKMNRTGTRDHEMVQRHVNTHNKSESRTTHFPRTDFMTLLKNWFDPRPQLKEMHQVVFWKDMVVEAMALGYILILVILLLNACKLVSDVNVCVRVCVCVCV